MDLRSTQLKDTYGNLVTTGTTAGSPTSGGLQNGQGTLLTSVGIGTDSPSGALDIGGQHVLNDNFDAIGASFTRNGAYGAVLSLGRQGVSSGVTLDYPADATFALSTNTQERMRIDSSGNVSITTGNLILDSGAGIDFSDTPNSSGTMTSELLDDYEEGTFTPTLKGDGTAGTFTYSLRQGTYTKIGRQVTVTINLATSGISVSPSGTAIIESLPFTSQATYYHQGAGFVDNLGSDNRQTSFQINPSSARIVLIKDTGTTTGHAGLGISEFSGNESIRLTATYFV